MFMAYQHTMSQFEDSTLNPHGGSFAGTSTEGSRKNKVVANIVAIPSVATMQGSQQNRVFMKLNDLHEHNAMVIEWQSYHPYWD